MNDEHLPNDLNNVSHDIFKKESTSESEKTTPVKAGKQLAKKLWKFQSFLLDSTQMLANALESDTYKGEWSEKAVEYHFARYILTNDKLANPLAGNAEEMFGDLITGSGEGSQEKFCLIEFKARSTDFDSEYDKYLRTMTSYGTGARPVGPNGGELPFRTWFSIANPELLQLKARNHHYFVYGAITKNRLALQFELYGQQGPSKPSWLHTFEALEFSRKLEFKKYLLALAASRSKGPPGGGGEPALYNAARTAVMTKFDTSLVLSDSGRVMSAQQKLADVTSMFEQWIKIDEIAREHKMQTCIDAYLARKKKKVSADRINEIRAEIRTAFEITRILEEMEFISHTHAVAKGGS